MEEAKIGLRPVVERMYNESVEKLKGLISAPQASPSEIRVAYNQYAALVEEVRNIPDLYEISQREFEELSMQLRIKVRADALSHFQDLRMLMGILPYSSGSSQFQGQHTQLKTKHAKKLPYTGGKSVERMVAGYEGQIDPKVMASIEKLQGEYVRLDDICKAAGYSHVTFYTRTKGKKLPRQGRLYLINEETIPVIFGRRQKGPKAIEHERAEQGSWMGIGEIVKEFGYSDIGEARQILSQHGLEKKGRGRGTQYFIPADKPEILKKKAPDAQDKFLTLPQALEHVAKEYGVMGEARLVQILEMHGADVQKGPDKFSKAKLDELLVKLVKPS